MTLISLVLIYFLPERFKPITFQKTLCDFPHATMYLADFYRHIIFLIQRQEGKSYV
jgi:hypothetical protein